MSVLTLALFMSFTVPPLEELIQRSEPWVRDDYTVTTQLEFHTSDFLRSDEEILLLHHAFLDDENQTLRTVVCTETRVIVLEEGVVEREIELLARPVVLKASPSGRYISMHREQDVPSDVRAFRVDTETGEQRFFDAFPGENPLNTWSYIHDDGQLFSVCNGQSWVFDHELNPSDGPRVGIGYTTPYAYSRDADIMYIPALRSAYNRRGDLLWTLPEEYSSSRVNQAAVSDDGSLVGLATRDGLFLIDGVTGVAIREYQIGGTGGIVFSPSSTWFAYGHLDEGGRFNLTLVNANREETQTIRRGPFHDLSGTDNAELLENINYIHYIQVLLDNGMGLLWQWRINSCFVLDDHLTPIYHSGNRVKAHPAVLSSSGRRLVHAVELTDGLPSFIIVAIEGGI